MRTQDKQDPVREAAVAWAEVEYRNATSFSRSDLALTVNAWRASREAALKEFKEDAEAQFQSFIDDLIERKA